MNNRSVAKFLESVINGDLVTCKKYFQKYEPFTWYEIRDDFGSTALHLAASHGYSHIVNFLLQSIKTLQINKNIIDDCDEAGCTSLQRAASNGHETIVRTTKSNTNHQRIHSFERDNNDSGYSKGNSPSLSSGQLELFDAKHHSMAFGSSSLV